MLLTHDGREKQITLVESAWRSDQEDRFSKKDEIIKKLEVFLLMLQSQVKLTVHTSDLVIGDQNAVHSHSDPESETWTWRKFGGR